MRYSLLRMSIALLALGSALSHTRAHALEASVQGSALLQGDYRTVSASQGVSRYNSLREGFLIVDEHVRVYHLGVQVEAKPQLRAAISPAVGLNTNDPARISVYGPARLLNLAYRFAGGKPGARGEGVLDWERLNLSYSTEFGEVYAGRRPVSLGMMRALPVWNKFSQVLPATPGLAIVYGQDSAGFRVQKGQFSFQGLALSTGPSMRTDGVALGEVVWNPADVELHLLGGVWWANTTGGLAVSKDVLGATLRAEGLWIGMLPNEPSSQWQLGVSAEYAATERLTLLGEWMHQSAGKTDSSEYSLTQPSRFMSLRASDYAFASAKYQISDNWHARLGALVNAIDATLAVVPGLTWSPNDVWELELSGIVPTGASKGEFSSDAVTLYRFPYFTSLGFPYQGTLSIKSFF